MKLGVRDKIFHYEMHTKTIRLHYVSKRCLTVKKRIHETTFTQSIRECSVAFRNYEQYI